VVAVGLKTASNIAIGQEIGKNRVEMARKYFKLSKIISLAFIVLTQAIIYFYFDSILDLFLSSESQEKDQD